MVLVLWQYDYVIISFSVNYISVMAVASFLMLLSINHRRYNQDKNLIPVHWDMVFCAVFQTLENCLPFVLPKKSC